MSTLKIPRGKSGPTTEAGKAISSRNASKHNCTSASLIVKGEDPREFDGLLASLTAEYQPETEGQKITVLQAARTAWDLARVNREFDKSQHALYDAQENMREWDAVQQAEFERMLRYRTRAERAYDRALQSVEFMRKLRLQAQQRAFWENLQTERLALSKQRLKAAVPRANHSESKGAKDANEKGGRVIPWPEPPIHLSQEIEIRIPDGTVAIRVHPSAEDMLRVARAMAPDAQVLRRFEFPDGVPAEYAWVNGPDVRRAGIVWTQYFKTIQDWRTHVEREAVEAEGRFLPAKKSL